MAYGDFKDLAKRTASGKVSEKKHFILLKILNMMDIKEVLLLWFINFLIKKAKVVISKIKLHKISINQLLGNFKKRRV